MDLAEKWGFTLVASEGDYERVIFYVRDEDGFCAITYNLERHTCLFYMSPDFYESVFELPDMACDIFKEFNRRLLVHFECSVCECPIEFTDDYRIVCIECNRECNDYMYNSMCLLIR